MRSIQYFPVHGSKPVWMHDEFKLENLVPGGAILRPESAPGVSVLSGSLVGRTANGKKFNFIAANSSLSSGNFVTKNSTKLASNAVIGATAITVVDTDGFVVGDSIVVGSNTGKTILTVDHTNKIITLTSSLAAAANLGATVELTTAIAMPELFLMATDIVDTSKNSEFTQLRHGRLIYINMLPDVGTLSADVRTTIQSKYQNIVANP